MELLENLRDAKYNLYLEVGNIEEINNMPIIEFDRLYDYLERRSKKGKHEPVKLRESNRRMIEETKRKKNLKKKVD